MIVGTGIDIAEVPRIEQSIERFGDRFLADLDVHGNNPLPLVFNSRGGQRAA